MRASRLLSILMLLQSRGRMSAQALADELEVSLRTVYRDVDELSASGVPVWAERGRQGGFQLQPGWRTRVDGLTAPEARAMLMGGLHGPAAQLGLGEAMASAQLKLLAALPEGWREDAQRVSSRFHLDPLDWYRGPSASDHLPAIAQAVWNERRIRVRYESWKGVAEHVLEPLGVVMKAGIWYMAASSTKRPEPRTYRLSNVMELAETGESFKRPDRFDLAAYWKASTRRFEKELYRDTAVVEASPGGLKQLRSLSAAVAQAVDAGGAQSSARSGGRAGWRRVVIPIESVDHAAGQLLRMGPEVVVIEPAELRSRLASTIRAMAKLYR